MADFRKIDAFFNGEAAFDNKEASKLSRRAQILRWAKLLMPSLAAVLIALLLLFPSLKDNDVVESLDVTLPKKGELEKLHMEQTEFSITDKDNKISTFFADLVDETQAGSKLLKITNPAGVIPTGENKFVNVDSDIGYYNQAAQIIELKQNVVAVYDEGTTAETEYARYDFTSNYGEGNQKVYAYGDWGKLWADGFKYYQEKELIVLTGKSKLIHEENTLWADKEVRYYRLENRMEAEKNVKAVNRQNTMYADLMKTYFAADSQNEIERIEAYDNVRVMDGKSIMHADKMIAFMRPGRDNAIERIEAYDNVRVIDEKNTMHADKMIAFMRPGQDNAIERIEAYGNVKVEDKQNKHANTLYADKMYAFLSSGQEQKLEKIEAFDNVNVITPDGTAKGDYGLYRPDKDEVELNRNVVIVQDGNVIKGDKAITNLTTSVSRVLADKTNKNRVSGVITGATVKGEKDDEK